MIEPLHIELQAGRFRLRIYGKDPVFTQTSGTVRKVSMQWPAIQMTGCFWVANVMFIKRVSQLQKLHLRVIQQISFQSVSGQLSHMVVKLTDSSVSRSSESSVI